MQTEPLLIKLTPHYNNLVITGPQAESFLQGQLTCDVKALNEHNSYLGAHCNLQGRMISLFRIYRQGDSWHLILPSDLADIAEKALKHYARFSKVTLTQTQPARLGIIGLLDSRLRGNDTLQSENPTLKVIAHLGNRFEYIGLPEQIEKLKNTLHNQAQFGTIEHWHMAHIDAGEAFLTAETSGEFLPHDINLPELGGVSF